MCEHVYEVASCVKFVQCHIANLPFACYVIRGTLYMFINAAAVKKNKKIPILVILVLLLFLNYIGCLHSYFCVDSIS